MAVPIVAIVDDDPIIVQLMERLLQRAGYVTKSWVVDHDVHTRISEVQPNVVILDLELGPISGWTILNIVRLNPRTAHVPMIVCSGDSRQLQLRADYLSKMNCKVIQKPFNLQALLDAVASEIGTPSS